MAVSVSGMFGSGKTYFCNSPVVIEVQGLEWPSDTPFSVVTVKVIDATTDEVVGEVRGDAMGGSEIEFNISSALRAMWAGESYDEDVDIVNGVITEGIRLPVQRNMKEYSLVVGTEYIAEDGWFTKTESEVIPGGQCLLGSWTEFERILRTDVSLRDVSSLEASNLCNGDASTKPRTSPERVGSLSITSWVDIQASGTISYFYPVSSPPEAPSTEPHAPTILRDTRPYADFLFINRRGVVETCSGQTLEALGIDVETKQYKRVDGASFSPNRTLTSVATGGRRSWAMSSGYQTREWAEWWTQEFLMARQWWLRYPIGEATGTYVPVIVEPAKKNNGIYDRTKQEMPHIDFTVTLAVEG